MENKKNKNLPVASGVLFSSLSTAAGTVASACCVGPGVVACSTACAPACGSLGFSIFGLSSTAVANWMSDYWMVFLILSVISFGVAYHRIFQKSTSVCNSKRDSRMTFYVSICLSLVLVAYSVLKDTF